MRHRLAADVDHVGLAAAASKWVSGSGGHGQHAQRTRRATVTRNDMRGWLHAKPRAAASTGARCSVAARSPACCRERALDGLASPRRRPRCLPRWTRRSRVPSRRTCRRSARRRPRTSPPATERRLGEQIMRAGPRATRPTSTTRSSTRLPAAASAAAAGRARQRHIAPARLRLRWCLRRARPACVNAFALPGGFIGVHTGPDASRPRRESELARGAGATRSAHVTQRHIARMHRATEANRIADGDRPRCCSRILAARAAARRAAT
ncbi:MAG: hypothetical protein MZW92_01870 [Comamonadaceae bacterium]|nr:hypothetical protein [Comamonadaceae bacterium]